MGVTSVPGRVNLEIDLEVALSPRLRYQTKQPIEFGGRLVISKTAHLCSATRPLGEFYSAFCQKSARLRSPLLLTNVRSLGEARVALPEVGALLISAGTEVTVGKS